MLENNNFILTIAGLDPSSGAGLTADIKTFEAHGLYGLSVCTAVTVQNDINFKHCFWISEEIIISQIETLFERFSINVVKIGVIESWERLFKIINKIKELNTSVKIILDPVLKTSSGFNFHTNQNLNILEKILSSCFFITPNYDEIKALFPEKNIEETIEFIANKTNLYLKGGHRKEQKGLDEVYYNSLVQLNIPPIVKKVYDKHGSGCVLSSALAANIALGFDIDDACRKTKLYTEQFLNSNTSLLGNHKNKNDK